MLAGARGAGRSSKEQTPAAAKKFNSMTLELFDQSMDETGQAVVLDLGPVCGHNIDFLANRFKRLYVFDLYTRLHSSLKEDRPLTQDWQALDFPPGSFDGILGWDLLDRLSDEQALHLAERCKSMMHPDGLLALIAHSEKSVLPQVHTYELGPEHRLSPRPLPHLRLPVNIRQNREILNLMKPLTPLKSFVYRSGMREFLFRKP